MAGKPYANVTPERLAKLREAQRLRAQGLTMREIGAAMGIARTTVHEYFYDPYREKASVRRQRYQGTCRGCGKPTHGSAGPGRSADLCAECTMAEQHENRRWPAEAILEAIRAFASTHGRPPTASEWSGLGGGHNPIYPWTTTVLREFGKWSDAIEQAGFPRPKVGHKTHGRREGMPSLQRRYTVLRETDKLWEIITEVEGYNTTEALNKALNGVQPKPGVRYAVVPDTHWNPKSLKPITRYEWADD